jgi:ACS family tartrate transporter-like MFS transporter
MTSAQTGWLVCIPYAIGTIFLYFYSRRADRTGKRALHTFVAMALAAVGMVGAGFMLDSNPIIAVVFLCLAAMGVYSGNAVMLTMPSSLYAGAAAAGALGFINAVGNIGGYTGPYLDGIMEDLTGSHRAGLLVLAAILVIGGLATWLYAHKRPEGDTSCDPVLVAQTETLTKRSA